MCYPDREEVLRLMDEWNSLGLKAKPPASQFATWLRLYSFDICADAFPITRDRLLSQNKNAKNPVTLEDFIRYASAVMRNTKKNRELDEEFEVS